MIVMAMVKGLGAVQKNPFAVMMTSFIRYNPMDKCIVQEAIFAQSV
jgi:hypothetical protein